MRLLTNMLALLCGLVVGAILSFWYLNYVTAEKSTMDMLVFIPIFNFYEPTFADYLIATVIAAAGGLAAYWISIRVIRLLRKRKLSPTS